MSKSLIRPRRSARSGSECSPGRQLRHQLVIAPGIQQAANILATQPQVDDVGRRQISLGASQDADHVFQLRLLRRQLARNAGLGRAVVRGAVSGSCLGARLATQRATQRPTPGRTGWRSSSSWLDHLRDAGTVGTTRQRCYGRRPKLVGRPAPRQAGRRHPLILTTPSAVSKLFWRSAR